MSIENLNQNYNKLSDEMKSLKDEIHGVKLIFAEKNQLISTLEKIQATHTEALNKLTTTFHTLSVNIAKNTVILGIVMPLLSSIITYFVINWVGK